MSTKILVVDDEPDNFDVIEAFLQQQDYVLYYAVNGKQALQYLELYQPDVILLDVMMPEVDGIEVCKTIKAMENWCMVPIIVVTALNSKEDLARCLAAGADDFISKPVNSVELQSRVHSMIRIKKQYDNIQALSRLQKNTIHVLQDTLDALRGNVASSFSHEINTPLNGLVGTISLLIDDHRNMDPEEIDEILLLSKLSYQRLERMTQRFLAYIKLELSNVDKEREKAKDLDNISFSLSVIESSLKKQADYDRRGPDVVLDVDNAEVAINPRHFKMLVDELLDNAFKFSLVGTPVQITGKVRDGHFYLAIHDWGRGMTGEQIAKIGAFIQFEREMYEQQGLGLGLHIVKKIVEIYLGKFTIDSVYQQETRINIALPLGDNLFLTS